MVVDTKEGLEGSVDVSELMGPSAHLHMTVKGKDVIVIVPTLGGYKNQVGQTIKLGFEGNLIHVFSKENERNLEFICEENYLVGYNDIEGHNAVVQGQYVDGKIESAQAEEPKAEAEEKPAEEVKAE